MRVPSELHDVRDVHGVHVLVAAVLGSAEDTGPVTPLGRALAALLGELGPLLLAAPLLIVAAEYGRRMYLQRDVSSPASMRCRSCAGVEQDPDARFCRRCGARL